MKTKEEYFEEANEKAKKEAEERRKKWTQEIKEEIKGWSIKKLEEEYVKSRLARISYSNPFSAGWTWDIFKSECRFCGFEYIHGHENCCDDCWEENKNKTLKELE